MENLFEIICPSPPLDRPATWSRRAWRRLRSAAFPAIPGIGATFGNRRLGIFLCLVILLGHLIIAHAEQVPRAKVRVSGLGLVGNLELRKQLRLMQRGQKAEAALGADQIEDIVLLAFSFVQEAGYLEPWIESELTLSDGTIQKYSWNSQSDTIIPRTVAAKVVSLHVRRGVRFYYESLDIEGLHAIPHSRARQYFVNTEALFNLKRMRVYTPGLLRRSQDYLREALNRRGYADASVEIASLELDSASGAARLKILVHEGLPSIVRSVEIRTFYAGRQTRSSTNIVYPRELYSTFWSQDFLQSMRANQYRQGFPDATAELSVLERQTNGARVELDLRAIVLSGTNIHIGAVRHEGSHRTRQSVLERFSRINPGEQLNRIRVEHARERLTRSGVFESVGLRYDENRNGGRDVVFELRERKAFEASLLFGYGSYDRLGGGVELIQRNVFGLAHQSRLKAVQTFKSTIFDYRYTVPEIFGENVDSFFNGSLLQREEISFTRQEYGGAFGVRRYFKPSKLDVSLRYDYQFLDARFSDFGAVDDIGVENAKSAAFILDLKRDLSDNPLSPRRGYKLFGTIEMASDVLGGDVDYQRLQLGASGHWDLGGGQVVHIGATHGMTFAWNGMPRELPFNRRFFPGGENSIRGYQYGEAAPRDPSGRIVGAEVFFLGNAEFEQFLTRTLSVVAFVDALGMAEDRRNYPFSAALYTVGGGLRWKTVIGPVRLEYGHNIDPRAFDPSGTLHFSFGFPF